MIILPSYFGGKIQLSSVNKQRVITPLTPQFKNLILNRGLNEVAANKTYLDTCHVGRSNVAPNVNQTTLLEYVASTANRVSANNVMVSEAPYFGISQIAWEFEPGEVDGIIREIGFGSTLGEGEGLFNRAQIRDPFGNPSYTVVPGNEALRVEYELTLAVPTLDQVGTIVHNGQEVGYTARPAFATSANYWCMYRADNYMVTGQAARAVFDATGMSSHIVAYAGSIGDETLSPGGDSAPARYLLARTYVQDSYRAMIRAEWDLNDANFPGGIKSLLWFMKPAAFSGGNSLGAYQIEFDEPLEKNDQLVFRIELGISWGNYGSAE